MESITVSAKSLNAEFPGLDRIALRVFGVDYESCTPNLRKHCQLIAKRDAAEQMYQVLRESEQLVRECEELHPISQNTPTTLAQALAKAEGRA